MPPRDRPRRPPRRRPPRLPDLTPRPPQPPRGRRRAPTIWDWTRPYFRVGDRVFVPRTGKFVTVTGIQVNVFGRVSYETRGHSVYLLEDFAPAHVVVRRGSPRRGPTRHPQ
jgi:hypothetical protein